jgi:hypothetical protein
LASPNFKGRPHELLGIWEKLHNPAFNSVEFEGIKSQTGLNSFVLTPKQWIEKTGAIGRCRLLRLDLSGGKRPL